MEDTDEALGKLGDNLVEEHRDDTNNEVGKEVCKAYVEVRGRDSFLSAGAISSLLTSAIDHCCNHVYSKHKLGLSWDKLLSIFVVRPDETSCISGLIILYDIYLDISTKTIIYFRHMFFAMFSPSEFFFLCGWMFMRLSSREVLSF